MIDGIKVYVLGAKIMLLIGKPVKAISKLGITNLPTIVNPNPMINCKEPKSQNHGPNKVQGFLVNVLIKVMRNKIPQIPANTYNPMYKPKETYPMI